MNSSGKFWEEQEQEIIEVMKRRIASKRPWIKCGTPKMIRLTNQTQNKTLTNSYIAPEQPLDSECGRIIFPE